MNQEIEREIDVKDALFYLLFHWRSLLVAGLVGLALLMGYKYVSFDSISVSTSTEEQENYERKVKVYELNKENYNAQVDLYQSQLENLQSYLKDSLLMQIDPMQECYASTELYVEIPLEQLRDIPESANTDVTDEVLGAYENFINKGIDFSDIAKDNNVQESMIQELITAEASYASNLVEVEVIAPDKELADSILKEIVKQSKEQAGTINADIRDHDLKVVNQTVGVRTDSALMDETKSIYNQINALQINLTTVMGNIEKLEEPVKPTTIVTQISKKELAKFGLIGLIVGVFILTGIYACIYIFSGVLATESELKDVFGCFLLGAFAPQFKKKGLLDRIIYRMAGVEKRSNDTISERIAENINSLAQKGQTVLLTGTVSDEILNDTLAILKDKVVDINLIASGSFEEDAKAIGMVANADAVVLVEARRKSKFAKVQKLLETVYNIKKPVLGYIMY